MTHIQKRAQITNGEVGEFLKTKVTLTDYPPDEEADISILEARLLLCSHCLPRVNHCPAFDTLEFLFHLYEWNHTHGPLVYDFLLLCSICESSPIVACSLFILVVVTYSIVRLYPVIYPFNW